MKQDLPNNEIFMIRKNTEKSPGDEKFAVSQTPVKDHQLTLLWKTHKKYNNNIANVINVVILIKELIT